jgi:hypothetical protein
MMSWEVKKKMAVLSVMSKEKEWGSLMMKRRKRN